MNNLLMAQHGGKKSTIPTISALTLAYYGGGDIEFSFTATFTEAFSSYKLYRDGTLIVTKTTNSQYILSYSTGLTVGQTYNFSVRAYDSLGQYAQSANYALTIVETTPPTISDFYVYEDNPVMRFYVAASDASGISKAIFYFSDPDNTNSYANYAGQATGNSPLQFSVTIGTGAGQIDSSRNYRCLVMVYDIYDNYTTTTYDWVPYI